MSTLARDLRELAAFGAHDDGAVSRFAWTPELAAANSWLVDRLRELELVASIDPAGNVIGTWEAGSGKAVLVGSHLDTVPRGGRYDGALGVLAALEALRLLRAEGFEPRRPVRLISFNDEEGARFGTGLIGSRAFTGDDLSDLRERRDASGVTLAKGMQTAGFDFDALPEARGIDGVACYLELHIEQGPVLVESGTQIGVVTGIVGSVVLRARLAGEANHAGTTPMDRRHDALCGAARVVLALREEARRRRGMTVNVGWIDVEPGGFNVIPGVCEFTMDLRGPDADTVAQAVALAREAIARVAAEEGLQPDVREQQRLDPAPMDPGIQDAIEAAAAREGATSVRMPSGAGHDAMMLARHVPTGMLFVPSRNGVSHSRLEHTEPEDCERGARVVARALSRLAG